MRVRFLTAEEEAVLARAWQSEAGSSSPSRAALRARAQLVEANLPIANKFAARAARLGWGSFDDLAQECALALMRAVETFDPARGVRFRTYAFGWFRAHSAEHRRRLASPVRVTHRVPYDDERAARLSETIDDRDFASDAPGADVAVADLEVAARRSAGVRRAMRALPARLRVVLRMRYADWPATLDEVAERLGVSRERARQLEARAIELIREVVTRSGAPARAAARGGAGEASRDAIFESRRRRRAPRRAVG